MAKAPAKKAPAKKAVVREGLTDKKLVEVAAAYEKTRLAVKELETEQEGYKKVILGELKRRGTKALEADGVKVTAVAQGWTAYSYTALEAEIGEKKAKRYRKREVDIAVLSQDVQAGKITAAVLDAITTTGTKAAYPSVTFTS